MQRGLTGRALGILLVAIAALACAAPASTPAASDGAAGRGGPAGAAAPAQGSVAPTGAPGEAAAPPALRQFDMPLVSTAASMVPFWVADEQGIFQRYGLDANLLQVPPATAAQALSAGSALVAGAGGSVVSAYVGGATDLVFIAGDSNKAPYRVIARSDIARMDDLRGKAVGLTTPGASPSVAMIEVLRRYGLEADRDVTFTYLRDTQATLAGLLTGVVDAIATSSPQAEYALAEGGHVLLDMRELNVPILGPQLATTRGLMERDPDFLRRVLMAYIDGIQYARDHPDDGIAAVVHGSKLDDRDLAELAYREYLPLWDPTLSEAAIQTLLDNMDVPAARTTRPSEMQDDRFLRELEQSGWLAAHLKGL
ncbi:MAG TPA: ABC transporter substrate-binding protein [Chloroflexota bacterium]|jgi:ABC-type nitrate/sulfonate/bicarbonate transport system substrate-binding protein